MEKIAVIGTGIAGMAASYFLREKFDITFYEKKSTPGGHTNTITVDEDGKPIFIDTGFMVYNEVTYPNLTRLFKKLEIPTQPTSMSFSVQHCPTGLEYCGTGVSGLFAQRKNIFNPRFIRLLRQIDRFNRESVKILDDDKFSSYSIKDYAIEMKLGEDFLNLYILPMSAAIWSTPTERMREFPVITLVRFFKNHGLLGLTTHHPWRTVQNGSRVYRDKILGLFNGKVLLKNAAKEIVRENEKVTVADSNGETKVFDKVILACHGDEALGLLKNPTSLESRLLKNFSYQKNQAVLHTDSSVMPQTRRAWSSWNVRLELKDDQYSPSTAYWMNSLQKVSQKRNYFVSINDPENVDPKKVLWQTEYEHPIFDLATIEAQKELPTLNQNRKIYFCGSYFRYGFHEDALNSAIDVAEAITGQGVWG